MMEAPSVIIVTMSGVWLPELGSVQLTPRSDDDTVPN